MTKLAIGRCYSYEMSKYEHTPITINIKCESQWPVGLVAGMKLVYNGLFKIIEDYVKNMLQILSSFTYGKFHDDTFHSILGKWQVKHDKIDGLISSEDITSSNEGQKRVGNLSSSSGNDNSHG